VRKALILKLFEEVQCIWFFHERNSLTRSNFKVTSFCFILGTLGLVGLYLNQPFITLAVTFVALFVASKQALTLSGAVSASILVPLLLIGLIELWSPLVQIQFTWIIGAAYLLVIAASGFLFAKVKKTNIWSLSSRSWILGIAITTPALITLILLLLGGNLIGTNIGWVLPGDAQTNTSSLMEIVSLNGFAGGLPAISQGIMAASVAATLGTDLSANTFIPIMQTQATDLAICWAILSVLFGLVACAELSKVGFGFRVIATLTAALLPLTSFVLGFSLEAGFYNTPFALLCLVFTWVFWREQEHISPKFFWLAPVLLTLTTLYALLAWLPLAVFPAMFLIVTTIQKIVKGRKINIKILITFVGLSLFIGFIAMTTLLPRVGELNKIASADGWMTAIPPQLVLVTLMLGFLCSILVGFKWSSSGTAGLGLFVFCAAAISGVGFLVLQGFNISQPFAWHYYPRKMAWMAIFVVMFIAALIFIGSALYNSLEEMWKKAVVVISICGLIGAAYVSIPFGPEEPMRLFPFLNIAVNGQDRDELIPAISSSLGKKIVRLEYDGNDFLANQWVFQWEKYKSEVIMWNYAYSTIQSPSDVCSAASTWGGGVTFFSKDESTLNATMKLCGTLFENIVTE
jgi:hypothetical protein